MRLIPSGPFLSTSTKWWARMLPMAVAAALLAVNVLFAQQLSAPDDRSAASAAAARTRGLTPQERFVLRYWRRSHGDVTNHAFYAWFTERTNFLAQTVGVAGICLKRRLTAGEMAELLGTDGAVGKTNRVESWTLSLTSVGSGLTFQFDGRMTVTNAYLFHEVNRITPEGRLAAGRLIFPVRYRVDESIRALPPSKRRRMLELHPRLRPYVERIGDK